MQQKMLQLKMAQEAAKTAESAARANRTNSEAQQPAQK